MPDDELEKALEHWRQFRSQFPLQPQGYTEPADLLSVRGRLEEAETLLCQAVEHVPDDAWSWFRYALVAVRRADNHAALKRWRETKQRFPNFVHAWLGEAEAFGATGQFAEAETALSEVRAKFPDDEAGWRIAAQLAAQRGDSVEALRRWAEYRQRFPQQLIGFAEAAKILTDGGRWDEADLLLGHALALGPPDESVAGGYAQVADRRGDLVVAVARWDQFRGWFPDARTGYIEAARLLRRLDRNEAAWELVYLAVERGVIDGSIARLFLELTVACDKPFAIAEAWNLAWQFPLASQWDSLLLVRAGWAIVGRPEPAVDPGVVFSALLELAFSDNLDAYRQVISQLGHEEDSLARTRARAYFDADVPDHPGLPVMRFALGRPLDDDEAFRAIDCLLETPDPSAVVPLFPLVKRDILRYGQGEIPRRFEAFERYIRRLLVSGRSLWAEPQKIYTALHIASLLNSDIWREVMDALASDTASCDASAGAGSSMAALLRMAAGWRQPRAMIHPAPQKLRIAVCVTGQLRGFREGQASWQRLGLDRHETRYFVHTWRHIGRRLPLHRFALGRCFTGYLLTAYSALMEHLEVMGAVEDIRRRYPALLERFSDMGTVTEDDVRSVYGTADIRLEDDTSAEFDGWPVTRKMHYKIEQGYNLAISSGENFDLYVRLRPDQVIADAEALDWSEIYAASAKDRRIFVDMGVFSGPLGGLGIGDSFAVGTRDAFDPYARTHTRVMQGTLSGAACGTSPTFITHVSPAAVMLHDAVDVHEIETIRFAHFADPPRISIADLAECLRNDIASRVADVWDQRLLQACDLDLDLAR